LSREKAIGLRRRDVGADPVQHPDPAHPQERGHPGHRPRQPEGVGEEQGKGPAQLVAREGEPLGELEIEAQLLLLLDQSPPETRDQPRRLFASHRVHPVRGLAGQQDDAATGRSNGTVGSEGERVREEPAADPARPPVARLRAVRLEEDLVGEFAQAVRRAGDNVLVQEVLGGLAQVLLDRAPFATDRAKAEDAQQQRLEEGEEHDQKDNPCLRGNPAQPVQGAPF